ncbi:MAG: HDOD domain-containing protein [Chromatiales bacterium]|jgi:HD-like signal output (HDOD) protein
MQLMPIDLVRGKVELPSLSEVFRQFTEKLDDPSACAEDFSEIISTDPALTARVLQLVNSAYYSFSSEITDIPHAITILGLNDLRELVLMISVVEFFEGLPNDLINMHAFWNHSVLTGLIGKELQRVPVVKTTQSMFTAGLLHDVGSLVIYNRLPEMARTSLELHERDKRMRYLVEREIIGFDHAAVGGELMRHWGLPEFLYEAVRFHHAPEKASQFVAEAGLIRLCDRLARLLEEEETDPVGYLLSEQPEMTLKLEKVQMSDAIQRGKENLSSVVSSMGIAS